jgi:hypothetical protein
MTRAKPAIILILAAVGFAASFFALSVIYVRITASYWRQQLDAAPDDGVEIVIRSIAELDTAGIPILVEALGAERECVALAAKQELFVQLEQWRMLSAGEYASRMTGLIDALAERVDRFNPAAQRDAADLASGILLRLSRSGGVEANKLLAASEKVLRAGINAKGESNRIKAIKIAPPALLATDDSTNAGDMRFSEFSESSEQTFAGLTPLIVDGLPGKSLSSPAQSNEDESEGVDSLANQPWLLGRQAAGRQRASRIPDSAETSARDKQSADSSGVHPMSHVAPEGIDRQLSSSLAVEDVVELMKELNTESDTRAISVEGELVRRGFAAVQIDLARRLFDHDPAVRKRLVQEMPGLQGVDAVPWLLELCRDTDAEVRLAAITFLATSSDPAVLDEVEQIGQRDTDSGVRRIADRIAQQHSAQK